MSIPFNVARDLIADGLERVSDTGLAEAWHAYAGQISYHHADDSGKEWGEAHKLKPDLLALETEILRRGGEAPTGNYLLGSGWRVPAQAILARAGRKGGE